MLNPFVRRIVATAVLVTVLDARPGTGVLILEPARRQAVPVERPDAERRYRIAAKVRMLFFWVGADDVGGARITWRGGEQDQSLALLIGSDPRRAPRGVNEWGYVREHQAGDATTVFGIRTVTDGNSPDEADGRRPPLGNLAELGVLCSRISPLDAASRTTSVHVGKDTTYRDVGQVLDVVAANVPWKGVRLTRPAGVSPGFLTALDLLIRSSARMAAESEAAPSCPRLSYVYKDAIYDLIPRKVERIPSLRTHAGILRNLVRSDIVVRNRTTGFTAGFKITYGTDGALAGIPVAATYQPNWWFKAELELDDDQDVPPDPAADPDLRRRIAAVCTPPRV
jgi:hypothetical protein